MMYVPFLTIRSAAYVAGGSVPSDRPVRPSLVASRYGDGTVRGSRDPGTAPNGALWDCDGRASPLARDSQDDRAWYVRALAVAERACRGLDVDPGDLVAELWIASRGAYVTARDAAPLVARHRTATVVARRGASLARAMADGRVRAAERARRRQLRLAVEVRREARIARNLARDMARRERVQRGEGQRGGRKVAPLEAAATVAVKCADGSILDVARVMESFAPSMRDMVELHLAGVSQCEIAALVEQSQATVSRKLAKVDEVIKSLRA